jgi:hypothetical protein
MHSQPALASRVGTCLLGIYFVIQGVSLVGDQAVLARQIDRSAVVPLVDLLVPMWPVFLAYLIPGLLLVFLARPLSSLLGPPQGSSDSSPGQSWLSVGIALLAIYLGVSALASLSLALTSYSLGQATDTSTASDGIQIARHSAQLALSVALAALARPLARALWRAA